MLACVTRACKSELGLTGRRGLATSFKWSSYALVQAGVDVLYCAVLAAVEVAGLSFGSSLDSGSGCNLGLGVGVVGSNCLDFIEDFGRARAGTTVGAVLTRFGARRADVFSNAACSVVAGFVSLTALAISLTTSVADRVTSNSTKIKGCMSENATTAASTATTTAPALRRMGV